MRVQHNNGKPLGGGNVIFLVAAGEPNADPASVVYDGVKTAIETNADVLFC